MHGEKSTSCKSCRVKPSRKFVGINYVTFPIFNEDAKQMTWDVAQCWYFFSSTLELYGFHKCWYCKVMSVQYF